ncbi:hypothetical protein R6Q59_010474, partial [Mikania micrantha]
MYQKLSLLQGYSGHFDVALNEPQQILRLDDAGKLYCELGFPRGRKVLKFIQRHPLVFPTYRHSNDKF